MTSDTITNRESLIGLQVRIPLKSRAKLFCSCENRSGMLPNTLICPRCLGVSKTKFEINKEALENAIRLGVALRCKTDRVVAFDRMYTSMEASPKGYQITQVNHPLCYDGYLNLQLNGSLNRIKIKTVHIEEDVAEFIQLPDESFIDFNSSGAPVVVVKTHKEINSPDTAFLFLNRLMQVTSYLNIAVLQDTSKPVHCSATVSIGVPGEDIYGTEKILPEFDSFHSLRHAIQDEVQRQQQLYKAQRSTYQMNFSIKEDQKFAVEKSTRTIPGTPETLIRPLIVSDELLNKLRGEIPELPEDKEIRLVYRHGINRTQADMISADQSIAEYFENLVVYVPPIAAVKWLLGAVFQVMFERKLNINEFPISAKRLGELINHLEQKTISNAAARTVFRQMLDDPRSSTEIIVDNMLYLKEDYDKLFAVPQCKSGDYMPNETDQKAKPQEIQSIFMSQLLETRKK